MSAKSRISKAERKAGKSKRGFAMQIDEEYVHFEGKVIPIDEWERGVESGIYPKDCAFIRFTCTEPLQKELTNEHNSQT